MQIVPFPAYYQSVYTNFDFTSFSLISCIVTVPISAPKCGSFTNAKSLNGKIGELFLSSETDFPFWLENFGRCLFVDIYCCPVKLKQHKFPCGIAF